jgi:glycosyltransferase involved in cell wall biosynthesis
MKKVLIVAYYFPPMGMGGVQRASKFVKYLPEFRWEPLVLTVKDVLYYQHDPTLIHEIRHAKIFRTESLDPLRLIRPLMKSRIPTQSGEIHRPSAFEILNGKISPWLCVPDTKIAWVPFALASGIRIIKRFGIDVIFTTSPPHSSHLVGLLMKKMLNIPWVVDFRDSWLMEEFNPGPTPVHRTINRWMLREVLKRSDRIIGISKPILADMQSATDKPAGDFIWIPNGFDPADFKEYRTKPSSRFRMTYCGTLSPFLSPEHFFRGLTLAVRNRPDIKDKLEVRFVGSITGIDFDGIVEKTGIHDRIQKIGYVPHAESIRYLMDSDLLVLVLPADSSSGMVTGKIFEYMASGLPILGVVPDGEAKRLILEHQRGFVVHPHDTEGIARMVAELFDRWRKGRLKIGSPRWKGMEAFDRRNQAGLLALIFNEFRRMKS